MPGSPEPAEHRLIDLRGAIASPIKRGMFRLVEKPIEHLLAIPTVNRLFAWSHRNIQGDDFFAGALQALNVTYDLAPVDLAKIPPTGPLLVVANHPFGGIDGLVLGDILTCIRPDTRLFCNHLLARIPGLAPWIFPVNPFGGSAASESNFMPLRQAMKWLRQGGALATFPAGTVSHLQISQGAIVDPPWHTSIASLARRTGATVVTLFFDGRNSMVFQLSGLIHPKLRTALLPSELIKRRNSRISVRIGRPIEPHKLARYPEDRTLTEYLRFKTYMLKWRDLPVRPRFSSAGATIRAVQTLAAPVPVATLEHEIARLPPEATLVRQGDLRVLVARPQEMPRVLDEIGRLREATFRRVQEGTGRARDLDDFDQHYLHLFLWSESAREVVGSYRIGVVADIIAQRGVRGLYTSTLFKFGARFLQQLGPALELGRAFVRAEHQPKAAPLALMWRGIGAYLVRNPHCKVLFGPVSISRAYQSLSRRLMLEFLGGSGGALAALVKPRNPPKDRIARVERALLSGLIRNADDLSALVSEIEADQKGVPLLLRHYLRLNASLLSFNVDPAFGHCIDGLILVDLRASDVKMLRRFMGDDGYARFANVLGPSGALL